MNCRNNRCRHSAALFRLLLILITSLFIFLSTTNGQTGWQEKSSEHFKVIYRNDEAYLVDLILSSAESSLAKLDEIFNFRPSEKIVFAAFDFNDYGSASTTTVPQNIIRLEIEPLEEAYENIPFNERIRWIINHELVHIVVNDQSSNIEAAARTLFAKVAPEQAEPLTILYSLLTNFNRYTPMWHQEGIAVFFETWLNGGYGRALDNFDEMYFRSLVLEKKDFPSYDKLDIKDNNTSFLLGTMSYLFGERFITYLAVKYGVEKVITWYREAAGEFYGKIFGRFRDAFGIDLDDAWNGFIQNEKTFQSENIQRIKKAPLTHVERLSYKPIGWVAEPYFDDQINSMIFGYHTPNHLAGIQKLNLNNRVSERIGTLPSPSLFRVASTAFDKSTQYFFYTTKNNELFRDLWLLDTRTGATELLFPDCRIGDLTISSATNELWGVIHSNGKTSIMYSPYPYKELKPLVIFNFGDEISDLSLSPTGNYLAAVLHRASGTQSIILSGTKKIKDSGSINYITITDKGSPEFPSWSNDEKYLYWNAYENGVSNIYRKNLAAPDSESEPISNVLDGLFKPVYLNQDSLFAFEFTAEGFIPVIIPNKEADFLPAIKYFGDEAVGKNPQVLSWIPKQTDSTLFLTGAKKNYDYNSLSDLKITAFIPVITGFQDQKVLGFYTHISDPLQMNDLTMEFGLSPLSDLFKSQTKYFSDLQFHFKGKYEYRKSFKLSLDYNAPDFYDLFNSRKRGTIGTKLGAGYTYYWVYDNPLKVVQKLNVDYYTGVKFLSDNLVKVSQKDFAVGQTSLDSKDLRKSIGSVDFESGNEFKLTALSFGSQIKKTGGLFSGLDFAGQIFGEWDNYSTWLLPHNVLHFKFSGGHTFNTTKFEQAKFYFGGFGNRQVENIDVNQFRNVLRFPGIPIYDLIAKSFTKLMIENELPPFRFSSLGIRSQFLDYVSLSVYSQALISNADKENNLIYLSGKMVDVGSQINFVFKNWYNLETTLSAGAARAWYIKENSLHGQLWDWFVSFKLLKTLD